MDRTPRSPRRPPKEGERIWQGRYVDKNLKDAWLESLNALQALCLISICEGHPSASRGSLRSLPHINLRLKRERVPLKASQFDRLTGDLMRLLHVHFDESTQVDIEYRIRLCASRRNHGISRDLVVRLHKRPVRNNAEGDDQILHQNLQWFEEILPAIHKMDAYLAEKLMR